MRIILAVFLTIVAASVAGCLWLVHAFQVHRFFGPERRTTFLLGTLDSAGLYALLLGIATLALLAAVVVGLGIASKITSTTRRRVSYLGLLLVLLVGVPWAGMHVLDAAVTSSAVYTEVEGTNLDRDLVVREWSFLFAGGGAVFERDGSTLTLIGQTGADDGQMPFARGDYTAVEVDGIITVEWEFDEPLMARLIIGDPTIPPSPHDGLYHYVTDPTP